jgi:hypothetical protein
MDQEPKSSSNAMLKFWLVLIGLCASLLALAWFGINIWTNYAKHTLLWDESKIRCVTYAGFTIPCALMLWFGVVSINKRADSVSDEKRKDLVQGLIVQPFACCLFLLAGTLPTVRGPGHVAREIYFALALAATSMMCVSLLFQFKLSKAKMHLLAALMWALLFCVVLHRCVWGDPSKGVFGYISAQ